MKAHITAYKLIKKFKNFLQSTALPCFYKKKKKLHSKDRPLLNVILLNITYNVFNYSN